MIKNGLLGVGSVSGSDVARIQSREIIATLSSPPFDALQTFPCNLKVSFLDGILLAIILCHLSLFSVGILDLLNSVISKNSTIEFGLF